MDFRIEQSLAGFCVQCDKRSINSDSGPIGRAIVVRQQVYTICDRYDFAYFHAVSLSEFRQSLRVARTILPFMVFP